MKILKSSKNIFLGMILAFSVTAINSQNKSVPITVCQEKNGKEVKVYAFFKKITHGEKSVVIIITNKENSIITDKVIANSHDVVVAIAEVVKFKNDIRVIKSTIGSIKKYLKLSCVKEALLMKLKKV